MKNSKLLFLLLFLISNHIFAQSKVEILQQDTSKLFYDYQLNEYIVKDGLKDGSYEVFIYDKKSINKKKVLVLIDFKIGKKEGLCEVYKIEGKHKRLKYRFEYKNGLKHGKFYQFSNNNNIDVIGEYYEGLKNGRWEICQKRQQGFLYKSILYNKGIIQEYVSFQKGVVIEDFVKINDSLNVYNKYIVDNNNRKLEEKIYIKEDRIVRAELFLSNNDKYKECYGDFSCSFLDYIEGQCDNLFLIKNGYLIEYKADTIIQYIVNDSKIVNIQKDIRVH